MGPPSLTPTQRAYIAGFFDGDGCVSFRKYGLRRPKIIITQKDPEILMWIQDTLGYGRLVDRHNHGQGYDSWELRIQAKAETFRFARDMVKYSIVKRKELKRIIRNSYR